MSDVLKKFAEQTFLPIQSTIKQAISNLDESHFKVILVVSEDRNLIGTISDGDIRRGLLRGLDLDSPIDSIIHREALVVPPEMSREMVIQIMQANKIYQLPVVDENRTVLGLHLWDELETPSHRTNLIVIMAGGRGTRLSPHTETCPKPLLHVAGKPILEHIIERAKDDGFNHFVIATHYLGTMIEDYFGNGDRWHVRIDYLCEDQPMGTAGGLRLLNPSPDAPFIVMNGDVLTDIPHGELLDFHTRHDASATMAVCLHEWRHPFGVVHTKGIEIIGFEEKPIVRSHINAGVYALDPDALCVLKSDTHCDMPTLFDRLRAKDMLTLAYPIHEPWLDIGRPDDFRKANTMNSNELSN